MVSRRERKASSTRLSPEEKILRYQKRVDEKALRSFLTSDTNPRHLCIKALEALIDLQTPESFLYISELLAGNDETFSEIILARLRDIPGRESLKALGEGIRSNNVFTRSETVRCLAGRLEPSAWSYLLRAARDSTRTVRSQARRLLLKHTQEHSYKFGALRKELLTGIISVLPLSYVESLLLGTPPPKVLRIAIQRMGETRNPEAVAFLLKASAGGNVPVALAAMIAIESNPGITASDIETSMTDHGCPMYSRIFACFARRCGAESIETLSQALSAESAEVRAEAVRAMFRLFGVPLLPMLIGMAQDPDDGVVMAVLDCLEAAPLQISEPLLVDAAFHSDENIQTRALNLAAKAGIPHPDLEEKYIAFADKALIDPRPAGDKLDTLCSIATTLPRFSSVAARDSLVRCALSSSARLRRIAAGMIETYPLAERHQAYERLIDSHDERLVAKVAFTLFEAGSSNALIPLIRTAMGSRKRDGVKARKILTGMNESRNLQTLCELLRSPHARVKQYTIERLSELADPRIIMRLSKAIEEGNAEVQAQLMAEIEELIEETRDDGLVRQAAIEEIDPDDTAADPRALEMLLEAARDEDELVQLAAVKALRKFVNDPRVTKHLIGLIDYGKVPVRQLAVEILGQCKVIEAVEPLVKALNNIFLRSYVEEALRNIGDRRGYLAVVRKKKREKMFPKPAQIRRQKLRGDRRGGKGG